MQKYEIGLVTDPEKTDKEFQEIQKTVEDLVEKHKGTIQSVAIKGKRRLAYAIKKYQYGHYAYITCNLPKEETHELEKELNLIPELMRFLIVKSEKFTVLKPRQEEKEEEVKKAEPKKEVKKAEAPKVKEAPEEKKTEPKKEVKKAEAPKVKEAPEEKKAAPKKEVKKVAKKKTSKEKKAKEKTSLKNLGEKLDEILDKDLF